MPPEATMREAIESAFSKSEKEPVTSPVEPQKTTEPEELKTSDAAPSKLETEDLTPSTPTVTPTASPRQVKPPVSWRPDKREHFSRLAPEIQDEVLRREREIETGLREASDSRKFKQEFDRVVQPYTALIESEGSTPIQAVNHLLQTAAALRTAPPQTKVQLVGDMVLHYGIDLSMLDQYLASKVAGQVGQPPSQMMLPPEVQSAVQFVHQLKERQGSIQKQQEAEINSELEAFLNDPQNEFASDVMDDMADILEVAAHRGRKMTLREAYERATMLHPEVSKVLAGRKEHNSVAQQNAAAERALGAAVSVSGDTPSQSEVETDDGSIRSAINAAITKVSRGSR